MNYFLLDRSIRTPLSWRVSTMKKSIIASFVSTVIIISGCSILKHNKYAINEEITATNVIYAGVRSSSYGIRPFPAPVGWKQATDRMSDYFQGSTPCAIWIVGVLHNDRTSCRLEFPSEGKTHENIIFLDQDKHESYLDYFDKNGIKVYLQVEPANGDLITLIDLVLGRYKHHECVIGFGVDVEWYKQSDKPGWGIPVSDASAKLWEERVKYHHQNYQLFLKHWDRTWMPPNYRGDILFVSDSQIFKNFNEMLSEYVEYWAEFFKPNMVGYQFGYDSDKKWWEPMNNPPKLMGNTIAHYIDQKCGIFWVDFTLRDVLLPSN